MADSGISVLIPIYNFEVGTLVNGLHSQLLAQQIPFEIRVYDDFSSDGNNPKNKEACSLDGVVYKNLPHNLGRSKIRNLLAKDALHDNLLFLDCDNKLVDERYITRYVTYFKYYQVLVGGTCYSYKPPQDDSYYLHWYVGKNKEEFPASDRNTRPYDSFTLNNMLIKKPVYMDILLDETITTYGHEDSKFGEELKIKKYNMIHVDNPVMHIGLNENSVFLEKSLQAVDNLCLLIFTQGIGKCTKLYAAYNLLDKFFMIRLTRHILHFFENRMYRKLMSAKPSLTIFDLYKLNRFLATFKKLKG